MCETIFWDYKDNTMLMLSHKNIQYLWTKNAKNDGKVVSNFIIQALTNKNITVYGDGSQTRSFCYVDDLVNGIFLMMKKKIYLGQ